MACLTTAVDSDMRDQPRPECPWVSHLEGIYCWGLGWEQWWWWVQNIGTENMTTVTDKEGVKVKAGATEGLL